MNKQEFNKLKPGDRIISKINVCGFSKNTVYTVSEKKGRYKDFIPVIQDDFGNRDRELSYLGCDRYYEILENITIKRNLDGDYALFQDGKIISEKFNNLNDLKNELLKSKNCVKKYIWQDIDLECHNEF